ncbi:MAG: hypothetical protein CL920_36385 [Deltaproteobacteria bacterium]|nr:hypothetical protein [Deltaproteobacteria bacterium]MBU54208.1 hypothetical protein [Deltaproteobacteria bacterium]|tara:strand:+ start:7401 stop:9068 length:1668 start_codon:yes stop_codon:yes gene_type:complete
MEARSAIWLGGILICVWVLCGGQEVHARTLPNVSKDAQFRRPFFSFLGLEGKYHKQLKDKQRQWFLRTFRQKVELKRFRYLDIHIPSRDIGIFIKKMVKVIVARSQGIAKMRAEWDSQFQGYTITTELLNSLHNRSFLYWLELEHFYPSRRQRIEVKEVEVEEEVEENGKKVTKKVKKKVKKIIYTFVLKLGVRLVVQKLHVLDCRPAHRKQSKQFARACRAKPDHAYAGAVIPYKQLVWLHEATRDSEDLGSEQALQQEMFQSLTRQAARQLGFRMRELDAFRLHAPLASASDHHVYLPIGRVEGLRLNQGFDIYVKHVSGKLLHKGYVKVRKIGDNRMTMTGHRRHRVSTKEPFYTKAQTITSSGSWRLKKGMLAFERPMWGTSFGLSWSMFALAFGNRAVLPDAGVLLSAEDNAYWMPGLRLYLSHDVSHAFGTSEWYVDTAAEFSLFANKGGGVGIFAGFWHAGLLKKFHYRQFVGLIGGRLGIGGVAGMKDTFGGFAAFTLGGELVTGGEFFVAPWFSLKLRVGLRLHTTIGDDVSASGIWTSLGMMFTF